MRASRAAGLVVVAAVVASCRSVWPPAPLPAAWRQVSGTPPPFAALYRVACCGRRGLLCTVRYDRSHLDLTVTTPPGGAVLRAWLAPEQGWLLDGRNGCVQRLEGGELPIDSQASLPLDPDAAAFALAGRVPGEARPIAGRPGWVGGMLAGRAWSAQIQGETPRCTRIEFRAATGKTGDVVAVLAAYRQVGIPGTVTLRAAGRTVEMSLLAWRGSPPLAPPPWLGTSPCAGSR
jgi:hypothetical protein